MQNSKFSENKTDIYTVNGVTECINDNKTTDSRGMVRKIVNNMGKLLGERDVLGC